MKLLDYAKLYHNFDVFLVLMDEAGYTDEEIMEKYEISKQRIYDARRRLEPVLEALKAVGEPKAITYGNPDVNQIVEAFKTTFGTTKASQYDRYAAKRLATKHGADNIVKVITALGASAGDKYLPSVNSVSDLEKKWVSIGQFLSKKSNSGPVEI